MNVSLHLPVNYCSAFMFVTFCALPSLNMWMFFGLDSLGLRLGFVRFVTTVIVTVISTNIMSVLISQSLRTTATCLLG
jgi:hypothetical protein